MYFYLWYNCTYYYNYNYRKNEFGLNSTISIINYLAIQFGYTIKLARPHTGNDKSGPFLYLTIFSSALARKFEPAALWGDIEGISHLKLIIHVLVLNSVTA